MADDPRDLCADCGHHEDAHDRARRPYPCLECSPDDTCAPASTTAADILAALPADVPAIVEQTGGGTATIYVGEPDADGRYAAAIGPGAYDYSAPRASRFWWSDTSIGRDDDGAASDWFTLDGPDDLPAAAAFVAERMAAR